MFTENDYFTKVLKDKSSQQVAVGEIATTGPELVVAFPKDTVRECLDVMTKRVGQEGGGMKA